MAATPESVERRVETLSRDLAQSLEDLPAGEREELRDYAAELVRQETERPPDTRQVSGTQRGNWIGILLLLFVAGLFFLVMVPPVGVFALLTVGLITCFLALRGLVLLGIAGVRRATARKEVS